MAKKSVYIESADAAILDAGTNAACSAMLREGVFSLASVKSFTAQERAAIDAAAATKTRLRIKD